MEARGGAGWGVVWERREGLASSPIPAFPPQANLPSSMEGPWEPWDTKVSRDSAPGSGRGVRGWVLGRGRVMGSISLGERAARQTRPGREWGGWGRAGHLTRPFFYLRHRHAELRVGPGPSRFIQARPGRPSLPGTHTCPCGRSEGLGGGAEKEREDGGDKKLSPGVRG